MRWSSLCSLVLVAGCAVPRPQPGVDEHVDRVPLEIRNETDLDADVFAYRFGQRYRLAFVTAHSVATVSLPLLYTDNGLASLYVHHIGETSDRDFVSNTVQIDEGSQPVLFLYPDMNASSLAVYQKPDR